MALILDTNGLSAMADGDPGVEALLGAAHQVLIPAIVIGEYRFGLLQSRNRVRYELWLSDLLRSCRVLVVDEGTAQHYADLRLELKKSGQPIPGNDLWIAALARQHGLALLSRDQHFDCVARLKRVSW